MPARIHIELADATCLKQGLIPVYNACFPAVRRARSWKGASWKQRFSLTAPTRVHGRLHGALVRRFPTVHVQLAPSPHIDDPRTIHRPVLSAVPRVRHEGLFTSLSYACLPRHLGPKWTNIGPSHTWRWRVPDSTTSKSNDSLVPLQI